MAELNNYPIWHLNNVSLILKGKQASLKSDNYFISTRYRKYDNLIEIASNTRGVGITKKNKEIMINEAFIILPSQDDLDNNFSHFIIDFSHLYYAKLLNVKTVIIGYSKNPKIEELVEVFYDDFQILFMNRNEDFRIAKAIMVNDEKDDFSHCERIRWFHSKLYSYFSLKKISFDNEYGSKLLITRQNAKSRRIINYEELKNYLFSFGFEEIDLSNFNYSQQFYILNKSSVIIGSHGAGLSACIFSNGTSVIDLTNKFYLSKDFFHYNLFKCLGFSHYTIVDPLNKFKDDILIDMLELKKCQII